MKVQIKNSNLEVILDDDIVLPSELSAHTKGYAWVFADRKWVLLHRWIMDAPKGMQVDHLNGNKLDCRRSNMRLCTASENVQNQKTWSKSGFKGVNRNGKYWQANIYKDKKRYFLGNFKTIEEAISAYNEKALELYGNLAYTNKM